jgi:hypothetical protein
LDSGVIQKLQNNLLLGIKLSVFGMHELFYAGGDPNKYFKRFGCWEVGVEMKIVKNKKETTK